MLRQVIVPVLLCSLAWPLAAAEPVDFDGAAWRAAKGHVGAGNPRADMLDALEQAHPIAGKTRGEVHALLGLPDLRERRAEHYALGDAGDCTDYVVDYDSANHAVGARRLCD